MYRNRNLLAFAVGNSDAEDALAQEDSFGMVAKSAMSEIREVGFGLVKPVVDLQIVFGFAAKLSGAAFRMFKWVGHAKSRSSRLSSLRSDRCAQP